MTVVTHELKASFAFIERNFNLTRRYWGWEVAFLVYSVAGALSISLIGASQGNEELLLSLMIGAIFWNYLSVVFSWIAETITIERWEGTLEYTMMAPIQRWTTARFGRLRDGLRPDPHVGHLHRAGAVLPAAGPVRREPGDGRRVHAVRLVQLRRDRDDRRDPAAALRRARAQMTFVLQSCLLLVRGVYYSVDILPAWMQVLSRAVAGDLRPRGRAGRTHRREAQ